MKLIDDAVASGWAHTRACQVLDVADVRVHRWRDCGTLTDLAPGGNPVHRLLAWEEDTILQLIENWGPIDRSHRKLAHRGSYTGTVFVSPSSVLRVAAAHQVSLPGEPPRPPRPKPALPSLPRERNRIWIRDASHFAKARRVGRTPSSMSSPATGSATCSPPSDRHPGAGPVPRRARGPGGCSTRPPVSCSVPTGARSRDVDGGPILVAWSDNGPEMTSTDTREFMALMAIEGDRVINARGWTT